MNFGLSIVILIGGYSQLWLCSKHLNRGVSDPHLEGILNPSTNNFFRIISFQRKEARNFIN